VVSPETALALGNLRRRGYAVTAILVMFEETDGEAAMVRLLAERIDVRHIKDEAELSAVCSGQMLR
jgi:hypothetical protein